MKKFFSVPVVKDGLALVIGLSLILTIIGCAHLSPGADPLVVRAEQLQVAGQGTLDMVVHVEASAPAFWKTNVPGFYNFAEWLKAPQVVTATNTTITLPRGLALFWSLDQTKLAYKSGGGSSNVLQAAVESVSAAVSQAETWLANASVTNALKTLH